MRAAIYTRVSTAEQHADNQRLELERFADSQGWQVVKQFVDSGFTGSNGHRPALKALFESASRREFDVLLVWACDRLTREGTGKLLEYLNRLTAYGIRFRSFQEACLDTVGPFGDVILALFATFAKLERTRLIERTKCGIERARKEGRVIGRPKVAVDARRIAKLRAQGLSWSEITRETGISKGTAQRAVIRLPKRATQSLPISDALSVSESSVSACP
jgi:DNA invertase Pin-like site-specific DNA recombinase